MKTAEEQAHTMSTYCYIAGRADYDENLAMQEFVSFKKGKEVKRGIVADDISRVLAVVKKEAIE